MTVLLVRHAIAIARKRWDGADVERPLTGRGGRQARGLVDQLAPFPIDALYSSRAVRCVETVSPFARARRLEIGLAAELFEGETLAALDLIDGPGNVLLCSHGDVLPPLLSALAGHLDDVPRDPPFAKGATWVIDRKDGEVTSARYLAPPA